MPRVPCPQCGSLMNVATGETKCSKCRKGRPVRGRYTCDSCGKEKRKTKKNPGPTCARCSYRSQECEIEGCENTNYAADGLCWMHYRRAKRHGSPTAATKQPCEFDGCERMTTNDPYEGHVLCHRHKQHFIRSGGRLRLLTSEERSEVLSQNGGEKEGAGRPKRKRKKRAPKTLWAVDDKGCWVWKGERPHEVRVDGTSYYNPIEPEVFAWLQEGEELDELGRSFLDKSCGNEDCVNPDHLEIFDIPNDELRLGGICDEGHLLTGETLVTWETGNHAAYCRHCKDLASARKKADKAIAKRERRKARAAAKEAVSDEG